MWKWGRGTTRASAGLVDRPARRRGRKLAVEQLEDRRLLSANVLMRGNNVSATGVNSNETTLSPISVNSAYFGKQFSTPLDGNVYAEPLEESGVNITTGANQGVQNVVYVATANDSVYAINAASGTILWQTSVINNTNPGVLDVNPNANANTVITAVPDADVDINDIAPVIGIIATPVIDSTTNTIYFTAKTKEVISGNTSDPVYVYQLYALNLSNGQLQTKIGSTVGTGVLTIGETAVTDPGDPSTSTYNYLSGPSVADITGEGAGNVVVHGVNTVIFNALRNLNRTSLTLANGQIYIGFASSGDEPPFSGWLLGVSASTMKLSGVFCVDPNGYESGIWQDGNPIVVDSSGALYFETGNGWFDSALNAAGFPIFGDYGDSVVKLVPDSSTAANPNINGWGFHVADYFAPSNTETLNYDDLDLSSSGLVLLPASAGDAAHPNLLVAGSKNGTLFLIDTDTGKMGEFNATTDNVVEEITSPAGYWSSPTYFDGNFYDTDKNGATEEYAVANAQFQQVPVSSTNVNFYYPGATASISADGNVNGIVWELNAGFNALMAFSAGNLSDELYNSLQVGGRDALVGNVVTFSVPMVANGMVYVGTSNSLVGYGMLTTEAYAPAAPTLLTATAEIGGIALQWERNSTNETAFDIDRSTNGVNFTQVGTAGAGSTSYVDSAGLTPGTTYYYQVQAVNPYGNSAYTNIASVQAVATPAAGTWNDTDIGNPAAAGSEAFANNELTVTGSGSDIWYTSDQFNYLYQTLTGNGTIIAQVASQTDTSAWAKAGVMIRASLAPSSAYAYSLVSESMGVDFQYRPSTGADAVETGPFPGPTAPEWLELVRQGNTITAYDSSDGINYYVSGTYVFAPGVLPATVYIGLAVTAHNNGALNSAVFNNVEVAPPQTLLSSLTPTPYAGSPNPPGADVVYQLNQRYTTFLANLNVNDAVTNNDSADFQVFADGTLIYDSGTLAPGAVDPIALDVTGVTQLRLNVIDEGSGAVTANQAGWTDAQLLDGLPSAPTELTAQIASGTQIDLSWTDTATNANGYEVLREGPGANTFSVVTTLPAQSTSYVDSGLTTSDTYSYEVEAVNTVGDSPPNEATAISLQPVSLAASFNQVGVSVNGTQVATTGGMDGYGDTLSSSLLGTSLTVGGVPFTLGAAGHSNVVQARGQTITLPAGSFSTLELLALGVNGSQANQAFVIHYTDGTTQTITQSISDWHTLQSFSGQSVALAMAYRLLPNGGADVRPFYLYAYALPINNTKTVRSITLPSDANVEILAMTAVAGGLPAATVAAPANLVATSSSAGEVNLSWTASTGSVSGYNVYRGTTSGGESGTPLNSVPLPATATSFQDSSVPVSGTYDYVVRAISGSAASPNSNEAQITLPAVSSTVQASLASAFNLVGITANGAASSPSGGLDGYGDTISANLLGTSLTAGGVHYTLGAAGAANVVQARGQTITLPAGSFSTLQLLAMGVNGSQLNQQFVVHYSDGSSQTITQSLSDWYTLQSFPGQSVALAMAYRNVANGGTERRTYNIFNYALPLNGAKTVSSITLPNDDDVDILAITLTP